MTMIWIFIMLKYWFNHYCQADQIMIIIILIMIKSWPYPPPDVVGDWLLWERKPLRLSSDHRPWCWGNGKVCHHHHNHDHYYHDDDNHQHDHHLIASGWPTQSLVEWATSTQRSLEVAASRRLLIATSSPGTSLSGDHQNDHLGHHGFHDHHQHDLRNDGTAVIADFGLAVRYRDENNSLDISPNTRLTKKLK